MYHKNINLKILICDYNSLTSLDVSNNINLEKLYFHNNKLTFLDVSKNINLKDLTCNVNQLTSLDVSKNLALTILACSSNRLTALDVSNNSMLERLDCSNNLTALDVSNNINLNYLACSGNKLTTLDVSKNVNLITLICYSNQLRFSTLKGDFSKFELKELHLEPQAIIEGGTKGFFELIDLSTEYNINGALTSYNWYDKATNQEVIMFASNGKFYASPANAGKTLICKMTNVLYPKLELEYKVTITNSMVAEGFYSKTRDFNIPEGFTLTGSGYQSSNLKVYPNPVTDKVTIDSPSVIEYVVIYDYSGKEVKKLNPVYNNEINTQDLATGNYILAIQTLQGAIIKKIIKK